MIERTPVAERKDFADRLRARLVHYNLPDDSPTILAREFNLRSSKSNVTIHAARKWLVGESIPTQDKLRILSSWLGVSNEWLRFGEGDQEPTAQVQNRAYSQKELVLLSRLQMLDEEAFRIISDLVGTLARHIDAAKRPD